MKKPLSKFKNRTLNNSRPDQYQTKLKYLCTVAKHYKQVFLILEYTIKIQKWLYEKIYNQF